MFGPSTFHMTYDYRSVDGQAVSTSCTRVPLKIARTART